MLISLKVKSKKFNPLTEQLW